MMIQEAVGRGRSRGCNLRRIRHRVPRGRRALGLAGADGLLTLFVLLALSSMSIDARAEDVVDFDVRAESSGLVTFEDVSATDNGTIVSRTWDFGDGTTLETNETTTTHRYDETATTYRVRLTIDIERTDGARVHLSTSKDVESPGVQGLTCGIVGLVPVLAAVGIAAVRKRGRPSILTEDVLAKIAELRRQGLGYGRIADLVRVGRTTVSRVLGKSGFPEPCQNASEGDGRPGGRP